MPKIAALALTACTLLLPSIAHAGREAPIARIPDEAAQKQAVRDIRNVGTAMFSWLTDQVSDDAGEANAEEDPLPCDGEKGNCLDVRNVPEISWEALRAILVPQYIAELPRDDPWGRPYEYRLKVENVLSRNVMSIRSAGADASYLTEVYSVVGFAPEEVEQDLVWADGFFVRWPQAQKPEKEPVKK